MTSNYVLPSGASFIVVDSMISRSAEDALGTRRQECISALKELQEAEWTIQSLSDLLPSHLGKVRGILEDRLADRVTHVVEENERVRQGIRAIEDNDLHAFGEIMVQSHTSSRNLYKVSHPNLDFLVESAIEQEGVLGARLSGAGFGGAVLALVKDSKIPTFMESISKIYESGMRKIPNVLQISIPGGVIVNSV